MEKRNRINDGKECNEKNGQGYDNTLKIRDVDKVMPKAPPQKKKKEESKRVNGKRLRMNK